MPRLFTALEIPAEIGEQLQLSRGGLPGARWIDAANYHVTLRFIGDVDYGTARDVFSILEEVRNRVRIEVTLDELSTFGGARPRAVIAKVAPTIELGRLQAEQERLMQRVGLAPETRKFTPHVTLARLRDAAPNEVAGFIAMRGRFPRLRFTAEQFVLFSARDSVGGGPYIVEAAYPLAGKLLAPRSYAETQPAVRPAG